MPYPKPDTPKWPKDQMPVGIPEIAELIQVKRSTVDQWRARGVLPEPDFPVTVGGRRPWRAGTIRRWAQNTGRLPVGRRMFRYVAEPSGLVVTMLALDVDDQWQVCCRWISSDDESEPRAHPGKLLKETAKDPEFAAWEHMTAWQKAAAKWGSEHPGEPLPSYLLET